jgi:hypothetical protein
LYTHKKLMSKPNTPQPLVPSILNPISPILSR